MTKKIANRLNVAAASDRAPGFSLWLTCLTGLIVSLASMPATVVAETQPLLPNFVVIFCDDLGYGDIGCFGSRKHRTPNIDRMADEGRKFTSFYSTAPVCTPSRSSLLTGCYPRRVNMHNNHRGEWVLFAQDRKGLHPDEITIAEVLKTQGYATACIGKWHLGDQDPFLPTRQGFDRYLGIPYSNDMGTPQRRPVPNPPLPLMRDEVVIEAPADQDTLTARYTREALEFIETNHDRPFFLYLPHTFPHWPLHAGEQFRGKSANGTYGDAVEEIDWSTGKILDKLDQLGIDQRTLVIFTSDNGAAARHGGSNAPLRGHKGSTWEGGMREPCVMRWPGKIPAGTVCDEMATTMDLMPTLAGLAGTGAPTDRTIDGKDIRPLLLGTAGAKTPHAAFYYYKVAKLEAVRSGNWKLRLATAVPRRGRNNRRERQNTGPQLYDLAADISETNNVADEHPDVVERLSRLAEDAREDLGDGNHAGHDQRPAGMVDIARPRVKPEE